ncbi:Calx-beta domain-containing protein [Candidatus Poriferisodalis sp.]|uniref:Calx-beta domain-containing protein n=1 Tax=Candidatus Poriferisodalis sp. TaxID=3101277 RepID=UPI003B515F80
MGAAVLLAGPLGLLVGTSANAQVASPTISLVSVASSPADTVSYLTGETIRFAVNFTSVVDVEGSPTLAVNVGGTEREAVFESVRGSEVLFGYTVTDDDFDSDGVSVGADKLSLGTGGAIADSGSRAASLTHVAGGAGHRVNMSVVTIAADSGDEPVPENETAGFTLSRTGNLSRALTVSLRAESRQHFVYTARVPSTVDFEPGRATIQFEVPLRNDADVETEDGSLTVTVKQEQGYLVGTPGSAVAVLTDDGDMLFLISVGFGGHRVESRQQSVVRIGLTVSSTTTRDRPPEVVSFTALSRSIETTATSDPVQRPADIGILAVELRLQGADWLRKTAQDVFGRPFLQYYYPLEFFVPIYDDLEPEIPERFQIVVDKSPLTPGRLFVGGLPITATYTIIDNEGSFDVHVDQPRVVDIVEGDVLELGLTAVSRFRFDPAATTSVEVDLEFVDGTATHMDDFVQLDRSTAISETVEITGFATVGTGDMERHRATSTVRISAVDNNDVDPVREFVVDFGKTPTAPDEQSFNADECSGDPPPDTPACYGYNHFLDFFPSDLEGDAGLSGYSMIVRIHDDDATPVAVTADESNIDEGANAVFTVTRNPSVADLPDPLTVGFDITETADFIDYSGGFVLPTSVTIAGNDTTAKITIPTVDDNVGDGPGEIVATLRPGTVEPQSRYSYTLTGRTASVAVGEDEPVLTIADASVSEGAGTVDLAVTLSGTSAEAIGFTWATAPATGDAAATAGQDYESAGGSEEISAGDTSATLTVTITDDALDELDNETFAVDLSAVTGAFAATPQATVTVADDDDLPEFSISDAEATEGPGASVDFTVSLDTASGRPTEVRWRTVSDEDDARPATEEIDYQDIGATLTIPAGETEATISVQLLDDGDHEPTETFEVRLANPSKSVIADGTGEARILDDDTPTISIDDLSVSESAGTAQATVRLTRPAYDEVTLSYGTVANTATAADYTHQSQVGVTIPAGLTTATVAVPILPDDIHEADESFFVDLSDPVGADLGSDVRAVITIVDDDAPPTLSVGDAQAAIESAGPLVFTVTRTGEISLPVTFSWSTEDGTAEAGSDFIAASGTVTIPATSSAAELQVQIVSDLAAEDDETVGVTLSNPINAVIIDGSATGVIHDDDQTAARTPRVVVDPSAVTVTEGGDASYTVALSSQPAADVTVAIIGHSGTDLSLSGTGLSSDDTLTFTTTNWNAPQTVTVSAADDADAVDDAAVTLTHTATSGSHSSAPVAVTVTITETDTAEVLVDPADLTVAENGSGSYTVRLATQPSADVTVTVTGHAGSDLTLSAARLTFTRDTWGTAQTVTVTAAADADGVDDKVTVTNTASGGGYGAAEAATVDVTIDDDGTAAIVVKPSALTMTEGGSSSYTVELSSLPAADVTVTVSAPEADLTILTVGPRTLRFTPSDWDQPQTVTLEAGYDADTANDDVTLTHTGEGGGYDGLSAELPVTVTDAESRAELLVVPSSISILEGDPGAQTYSVALGSRPTGDVTVTISGHAGSDVTLSGATLTNNELTFTIANWNAAKEITLTAAEDDDTANDDVTLTNTATGGGYGTATAIDVAVTILDNDTPGLVVTPTEVRVTEGDEAGASYQVSLANRPTTTVLVTTSANSTDVDVVPATILFTNTNWSDPQTITVTARDDPGFADEEVVVDHSVTFGTYAASAVEVQVIVEDDDMPGLTVNPRTLSVMEGASATYDVELTVQPSADVTVTIGGHDGTDITLSGDTLTADSLTFTADNWNQAQSVTATAGQDADTTDDMVTLIHTASGGGYDSLEPVGVAVTLIDDDGPRIDVPAAVTVVENASATYGVKLAVQPSAEVTVTVSGHADSDVTLSGNALTGDELTFTTSNWASAQTVTVTAKDDDNAVNESVVLTHTATGGDYAGLTAQVAVTVVDDDEPEIIVSDSEVTIDEADPDGAVYEVRLATEPSQMVEVEVRGVVGTDLIRTPEVLTFDSSTWNTAKTVKVTAPPDADTMHEEEVIVHRGSGGDYEGTTKTVTVIVQDDDIPPGVVIDPTMLTVTEGAVDINGDPVAASYTVVLTVQPTANVVIEVAGHSTGGDVSVNSSTSAVDLTFTDSDWSTPQTVTVTAVDDDVAEGDEAVVLTHILATTATEYADVAAAPVTVSIVDDDAVGVRIDPTTLTVLEGDTAGAVYAVVLASQPAGDVTVAISGHTGTDVTVSGNTLSGNALTFTTTNWSTPQTIKVTAAADDDAVADADVTLTHDIASSDDAVYDALGDQTVTVAITEKDTPGVVVDPTTLTVLEADTAGQTYTVVLASQPAGDVTVAISGHTDNDVTVSGNTLSGNALTFTTTNWSTPQTIKVTAAADDDAVADADVTLTHDIASSDDAVYDALGDQTVTVTITEKDTPGVVVDPTTLTVLEADTAGQTYTVVLASQPAGNVTVAISGHTGTDVTVSGNTLSGGELTFTTSNWATPQQVTVAAAADDDAVADDDVTLTHDIASSDDAVYDALGDQTVTVTITEKDAPGVRIDPTTLTVLEGDTAGQTYTVVLASQPAGDVTVAISGHTDNDVAVTGNTLSGNALTFTTTNWSTPQTIKVTAAADDDAVADDAVVLVHDIASDDDAVYDALGDQTVTVAITEKDTPGVVVDPTTLTVLEADTAGAVYTVVLASQPAGDVTVAISGHTGTDVTVSGNTLSGGELTFTTTNWSTPQTIKVTAAADDDAVADDAVVLVHDIASDDDAVYDALGDQTVTVAITEKDAPGVRIDPVALTVLEGDTAGAVYTVVLASQPAGDVTVAISGHTDNDVAVTGNTLSGNALTFTTTNWSTPQTIKVTAAADDDAVADDAVVLVHTSPATTTPSMTRWATRP